MSFEQFKVLTFDVVGTLIDFERGIIDYIRASSGKTPAELGDEVILEAIGARAAPGLRLVPRRPGPVYQDMAQEFGLPRTAGPGCGTPSRIGRPSRSVAALKRLRKRYRLRR
jgi:putative hydrolase of the HAD superfamily